VLASEIAAKLGVGSHRVGNIIGRKLLYVEVERKPMKDNKETPYLYRRIKHVPPRKHTNAAAVSKDGMRRSLKQSSEKPNRPHSVGRVLGYSRREDQSGVTFNGTAIEPEKEYGVRFIIQIGSTHLVIQTEPSRTGYLLTEGFTSTMKDVLGEPSLGPKVVSLGRDWPMHGETLITNWALPEDRREKVIREVERFLEGS